MLQNRVILDKINMEMALPGIQKCSVYDGRRDNPLNLEVIRIFQIFILCIILASGASQKKL